MVNQTPGKTISITVIQVYVPAIDGAEGKTESFYAGVPKETDHTSKQDMLVFVGGWNSKAGRERKGQNETLLVNLVEELERMKKSDSKFCKANHF